MINSLFDLDIKSNKNIYKIIEILPNQNEKIKNKFKK